MLPNKDKEAHIINNMSKNGRQKCMKYPEKTQ